ncbi:hypothetical protein P7K49_021198, partial [Saguinus oedipus]
MPESGPSSPTWCSSDTPEKRLQRERWWLLSCLASQAAQETVAGSVGWDARVRITCAFRI